MSTNRKIAILVGVLFIVGTAAGMLSVLVTLPILDAPDVLQEISANAGQMLLGALLVLTMGLSLAMIPVVIFPVLKRHNETLALGYVVFRGALETVTYLAIAIGWLLLIPLSQAYASAAPEEASGFQVIGALLLKEAGISATLTAIVFPLGALMLYAVLYQSRLIPRWLSAWGLIAVILHFVWTGLFGMFAISSPIALNLDILNLPIFLQEMVMAVWLIVKGFNPSLTKAATTSPVHVQAFEQA